jgi:diguanylate cyclase (GGDEF)-like protein/PAS domain S-box-containing protein
VPLNALRDHIAVVGFSGEIFAVNQRWREFARANGGDQSRLCEGANYLETCDSAGPRGCQDATKISGMFRQVAAGERQSARWRYACHSPTKQRWFEVNIGRSATIGDQLIVSHHNITPWLRRAAETGASTEWRIGHGSPVDRRQDREFFEYVFDRNPLPMVVYACHDFRFLAVNDAAIKHYGYTREQFLAMTALDIRPALDRERFKAAIQSKPNTNLQGEIWQHLKADGSTIDVAIFRQPLFFRGESVVLVALFDMTEQINLTARLLKASEFFDAVVDNIPVGLAVKRVSDRKYVLINRAAAQLFPQPLENALEQTAFDLFPARTAKQIDDNDRAVIAKENNEPVLDRISLNTEDGRKWFQARRLIFGSKLAQRHILAIFEDVTQEIEAQSRIAYLAHHDSLTGLPNRHTFELYLGVALERAQATNDRLAILYMGIDHFKELNETFGTEAGDSVLRAIGERLTNKVQDGFIARMGGDQFAVLCTAPQPLGAEWLARSIFEGLSSEIEIGASRIKVEMSMGVAIFPGDAEGTTDLLANAESAMEKAKSDGTHGLRFFNRHTDTELRERRALHHDLRFAQERNELRLDYQPLVTCDRSMVGFEVLARWTHPRHGEISPAKFIPLAEDGGLIFGIGRWILGEACREAASWANPLNISVNLSTVQFRQGAELVSLVRQTLEDTGLDPKRLEFEVTESGLEGDRAQTVALLRELRSLGVRIAVDDFGTGYSSLSRLKDFPLDKIKIDRSFVAEVHINSYSGSITRSIIELGHALGLVVLAEGVETEQQLAILKREGCDQLQGYLLGRPMPIDHYRLVVRGN